MVGITAALYDEVFELVKGLRREKKDGIYHYHGFIGQSEVSLFLTGPGLKKNKGRLKKWLSLFNFSGIIQTGFCGALRHGYMAGDVCRMDEVFSLEPPGRFFLAKDTLPEPAKDGIRQCLISVSEPVFKLEDREDLFLSQGAHLVDMESAELLGIVKEQRPALMKNIRVIKIVGDVAGEEQLMNKEVKMRAYFTSRGFFKKLKIGFLSGPVFFKLYGRKRRLQKVLRLVICNEVKESGWR